MFTENLTNLPRGSSNQTDGAAQQPHRERGVSACVNVAQVCESTGDRPACLFPRLLR